MKKLFAPVLALSILALTGCSGSAPLTEAEQAAQYGLTVERFREEKNAAARMNMSIEAHMKMIKNNDGMERMNHN